MTPPVAIAGLPVMRRWLRPGTMLEKLQLHARALIDVLAVEELSACRRALFSHWTLAQLATNPAGNRTGTGLTQLRSLSARAMDSWTLRMLEHASDS